MFCKYALQLKEKLAAARLKGDCVSDSNAKFAALFGPPLHTRHSETYFSSASYHPFFLQTKVELTITPEGKITNMFENQQQTTSKWLCNDKVCKLDKQILLTRFNSLITSVTNLNPSDFEKFIEDIDVCTNTADHIHKKRICKCGKDISCSHTSFDDNRDSHNRSYTQARSPDFLS